MHNRQHVAAFTENYTEKTPAYISVNKLGDDEFTIAVRTRGEQNSSTITLNYTQLRQLTGVIFHEGLGQAGAGG